MVSNGFSNGFDTKKIDIQKRIGFGIVKVWNRKKYWILYRKNLVSEKVFGYGFVQILGILGDVLVSKLFHF